MYTNYRELQPKYIAVYIYIILHEKIAYVIYTDISKYVGIYKLYINTYSLYSYIKHIHTHTHIYIYIYIERERERETERQRETERERKRDMQTQCKKWISN